MTSEGTSASNPQIVKQRDDNAIARDRRKRAEVTAFATDRRRRLYLGVAAAGLLIIVGAVVLLSRLLTHHSVTSHDSHGDIIATCSVVSGSTITAGSIDINCGPTAAEIKATVSQFLTGRDLVALVSAFRDHGVLDGDKVTQITDKLHLTQPELIVIMKALAKENTTSDNILARFAQLARDYISLALENARLESGGPAVKSLREQAAIALQDGEMSRAKALLQSAEPPRSSTDVQGQGSGGEINVNSGKSTRTTLIGQAYQDPFNPLLIEVNKIYTAQFSGDYYLAFRFVVPGGVRKVQFQYKAERNIPCEINLSYWEERRLEYFTQGFTTSTVLYTFGVQEGDLGVARARISPTRPSSYKIMIRPLGALSPGNSPFDFAIITQ